MYAWQLEPFYFAPTPKLGGGWIAHKDSRSPPPAPDYAAAARTQGSANLQTAIANNVMNRPTEVTPYGTRSWTQSGSYTVPGAEGNPAVAVPTYTSNINLTPTGQQLLDMQNQAAVSYGNTALQGLGRINQAFNKPLDEQGIRDLQEKAYSAQTSRLDPQFQTSQAQLETKLVNQGLRPGSEAWDNEMRVFNQGKNDAYTQARLAAASQAPALLQQELAIRNQPLSEVNALRTGSQPSIPQFQPFATSSASPAPLFQGAQAQAAYNQGLYNQQVAADNSMMGGLFGLGGSVLQGAGAAGGFGNLFSDRRLKSNIKRIGNHRLGIGVYEYEIFGRPEIGVMADEVMKVKPEAVSRHASGYLQVNYGML